MKQEEAEYEVGEKYFWCIEREPEVIEVVGKFRNTVLGKEYISYYFQKEDGDILHCDTSQKWYAEYIFTKQEVLDQVVQYARRDQKNALIAFEESIETYNKLNAMII